MSKTGIPSREPAETLAIQALSYLAQDPEQLSRFLALSGIDPGAIRAAAAQPEFLAGVLAYLAQDEALLVRSFRTVVIDRHARLASNIEGNDFTARQLGDLVETMMAASP